MNENEIRAAVRSELAEHVPPRLLKRESAAAALGVSERTIDKLIASGELRSVRIGKRRLVPVTAIDLFVSDLAGAA